MHSVRKKGDLPPTFIHAYRLGKLRRSPHPPTLIRVFQLGKLRRTGSFAIANQIDIDWRFRKAHDSQIKRKSLPKREMIGIIRNCLKQFRWWTVSASKRFQRYFFGVWDWQGCARAYPCPCLEGKKRLLIKNNMLEQRIIKIFLLALRRLSIYKKTFF